MAAGARSSSCGTPRVHDVLDHPLLLFALSFLTLWIAARFGASVLRNWIKLDAGARTDFGTVLATTLTLNGLIIGFTFSMAIGRYELRKNYEEAEANAIGTEFVRADLLPAPDAARVRELLRDYLDQRVSFYKTRDGDQLRQIDATTAQLETD